MAASIMESLFQRSLDDVVKGLQVQIMGEGRYLAKVLEEVRKEIKSSDGPTKVVALQKLTYLNMLQGADMGWAAFHVIEVMSMPKFAHKKIGYLAASQAFYQATDVLVLITNLLRKDLCSKNEFEAGLALDCLSRIATPDLARDLTPELFTMLASPRVYVRRKATLVLLRVFSKYPDAIKMAFKRLVDKMEDPDPQVVGAAVSVICELALKDPKPYLPLAPLFNRLLAGSYNNWMNIKLVKIFGVLAPLEPRLGRKIADPICDHMRKTPAKSLLFECIRTVMSGLADNQEAVKLAVEKLRELLEQDDPNLKYLGLQTLATIMPIHPWAVAENREVIVRCLKDPDISVQMGSLRLVMGMVAEANLMENVQVLLQYVQSAEPRFCNELISSVLSTCSRALYELVSDFSWYVNVLGEIARIPHNQHGEEVGRQLIDIGLRVAEVREDLVRVARYLLLDPALLGISSLHDVLSAAAWVSGEYVKFSHNPYELIQSLLQPRTRLLPPAVHAVYLQAALKSLVHFSLAYLESEAGGRKLELSGDVDSRRRGTPSPLTGPGKVAEGDNDLGGSDDQLEEQLSTNPVPKLQSLGGSLSGLVKLLEENVTPLGNSVNVEVQERACNMLGLLQALKNAHGFLEEDSQLPDHRLQDASGLQAIDIVRALSNVFAQDLGPVSVYAQERVTVPEGLTLTTSLDAIGPLEDPDDGARDAENDASSRHREWDGPIFDTHHKQEVSASSEGATLLAQHRQRNEHFYLPKDPTPSHDLDYPAPTIAVEDASTPAAKPAQDVSSSNTKPKKPKVRPVVVKLEDEGIGSEQPKRKAIILKDEFLSNAIRDVLTGDSASKPRHSITSEGAEASARPSSSSRQRRRSHRSSRAHGKTGQDSSHTGVSDGSHRDSSSLDPGEAVPRTNRKHEERSGGGEFGRSEMSSGKQKHRQSSSKHHRQRARSTMNVMPTTQDLLL